MADFRTLPPNVKGYLGTVLAGVEQGLSTTELWQTIRDATAALGEGARGPSASQVSTLRGLAGRMLTAAGNLSSAPASALIDSSMISPNINSRPLSEQAIAPAYQLRYEATVLTSEGETTRWFSVSDLGSPGLYVADLQGLAEGDAMAIADASGEPVVGLTGNLQLYAL